eukprot:2540744-Amphidinium_carterae.2
MWPHCSVYGVRKVLHKVTSSLRSFDSKIPRLARVCAVCLFARQLPRHAEGGRRCPICNMRIDSVVEGYTPS